MPFTEKPELFSRAAAKLETRARNFNWHETPFDRVPLDKWIETTIVPAAREVREEVSQDIDELEYTAAVLLFWLCPAEKRQSEDVLQVFGRLADGFATMARACAEKPEARRVKKPNPPKVWLAWLLIAWGSGGWDPLQENDVMEAISDLECAGSEPSWPVAVQALARTMNQPVKKVLHELEKNVNSFRAELEENERGNYKNEKRQSVNVLSSICADMCSTRREPKPDDCSLASWNPMAGNLPYWLTCLVRGNSEGESVLSRFDAFVREGILASAILGYFPTFAVGWVAIWVSKGENGAEVPQQQNTFCVDYTGGKRPPPGNEKLVDKQFRMVRKRNFLEAAFYRCLTPIDSGGRKSGCGNYEFVGLQLEDLAPEPAPVSSELYYRRLLDRSQGELNAFGFTCWIDFGLTPPQLSYEYVGAAVQSDAEAPGTLEKLADVYGAAVEDMLTLRMFAGARRYREGILNAAAADVEELISRFRNDEEFSHWSVEELGTRILDDLFARVVKKLERTKFSHLDGAEFFLHRLNSYQLSFETVGSELKTPGDLNPKVRKKLSKIWNATVEELLKKDQFKFARWRKGYLIEEERIEMEKLISACTERVESSPRTEGESGQLFFQNLLDVILCLILSTNEKLALPKPNQCSNPDCKRSDSFSQRPTNLFVRNVGNAI